MIGGVKKDNPYDLLVTTNVIATTAKEFWIPSFVWNSFSDSMLNLFGCHGMGMSFHLEFQRMPLLC